MNETPPLYKSWRGYAFLFSLISLWAQASALIGKVSPMVADGLTAEDALEILNQAGPMLQSTDQVLGMLASAVAAVAIAVSKIRTWIKVAKERAKERAETIPDYFE